MTRLILLSSRKERRCPPKKTKKNAAGCRLRSSGVHFGGEPEGSLGGLEWSDPSFLTMLCSCYPSDDETFALGDGGLKG